MAIYTQTGNGFAVPGGDLPFTNTSLLDIPAGTIVRLDTTAGAYHGVLAPTAAGAVTGAVGIALHLIPAGARGAVRCYGVGVCTANGTIAAGDPIQASNTAAKLGFAKTASAATTQVGVALTAATDGNPVEVLVGRAFNALFLT